MSPISPPVTPPPPISYTALDIIRDAFIEIGACPPGEDPSPEEAQWGFRKVNDLLDSWSADKMYVYAMQFQLFDFPSDVSPVTFGPSPDANWQVPVRPPRIEGASLILNSADTVVDLPINLRDYQWWIAQQVKQIKTNVPTDLYPEYAWPDANLYFWPVINVAYQCRLCWWRTLTQFTAITDPLFGPGTGFGNLPPGYRNALKLTLAETLLPGSDRDAHPVLIAAAAEARRKVFANNDKPPRMSTKDLGMTVKSPASPDFNWFTGNYPGGPPE